MINNNKNNNNILKKAIISGCSVITEMLSAGLFFENIKLEKQRTSLPYRTIASNLLKNNIKGYWSGFIPWGATLGFGKGFVIGGSKSKLDNYFKLKDFSDYNTNILSGFGAGACQGAFMSPLIMARIRVNQSLLDRSKNHPLKTSIFNEIKLSSSILNTAIKEEGPSILFKGMPVMIAKQSLDWGARFTLVDTFRRQIIKENNTLTEWEKLYTAWCGGALSVSFTMPIDRVIPLIQESNTNKKPLINILFNKINNEGITTMFRGWRIRTFQCGYHTTFAIFLSDKIYNYFDCDNLLFYSFISKSNKI